MIQPEHPEVLPATTNHGIQISWLKRPGQANAGLARALVLQHLFGSGKMPWHQTIHGLLCAQSCLLHQQTAAKPFQSNRSPPSVFQVTNGMQTLLMPLNMWQVAAG